MARPIRVEFPGAVYHVMARGNERRAVFRDDRDRSRFLDTLAEMVERFGARVHAYCLMPNHYHLIVETPRANLSQAPGWLQVTYTVRFNRRHRRSGHLFQGRFKAQLVEADSYAQWLVAYMHLNPVRPRRRSELLSAERANELDAYVWSSHRDYAGLRKKAGQWLCLDWLRYWAGDLAGARREYRRQIARMFVAGEVRCPWEQLRAGLVLGGEELWQRVGRLIGGKNGREETAWTKSADSSRAKQRIEQLLMAEADDQIKLWALVRLCGQRQAELGRRHGYRDGSGVAYVVRRVEQQARADRKLAAKLQQLRNEIYRL
jgi:REP element-mobilizing transposase RayT